jgi:hypothetical protein
MITAIRATSRFAIALSACGVLFDARC